MEIYNPLLQEMLHEAKMQTKILNKTIQETLHVQQEAYNELFRLQNILSSFPGVIKAEDRKPVEIYLKYIEDFELSVKLNNNLEIAHDRLLHGLKEMKQRECLWRDYQKTLITIRSTAKKLLKMLQSMWEELEHSGRASDVRFADNVYGRETDYWPMTKRITNDLLGKKNREILYWAGYLNRSAKQLFAEAVFLTKEKLWMMDDFELDELVFFKELFSRLQTQIEELSN